jgi:hypothetical protein
MELGYFDDPEWADIGAGTFIAPYCEAQEGNLSY